MGGWKNEGTVKITISRAKVRACRCIDCRLVERVSAPVLRGVSRREREETERGCTEGGERSREGMKEGETTLAYRGPAIVSLSSPVFP